MNNEMSNIYKLEYNFNSVENIYKTYDTLAAHYLLLFVQTDMLLEEFFENYKMDETGAIDYFKLANWLGIDIRYDNLNIYRSKNFSRLLGKLEYNDDKPIILLERDTTMLTLRYTLAHEIGHFLCFHKNVNCIGAKIPADKFEYLADVVCAFLILPPKATFKLAENYTQENKNRPVDLTEMLMYLSRKMRVPYYTVISSYEYLKFLACYLRTEQSREHLIRIIDTFFDEKTKMTNSYKKMLNTIESYKSIAAEDFFV